MKKLFLASYFKETVKRFAAFEPNTSGKTITFIPTASNVEDIVFYVAEARQEFKKLGLVVDELDLSTATTAEISAKLRHNDFIYVSGGNTFYLLQELKRTGADQLIVDQVNSGKLYIGESAGAIVASPSVAYAQEMDNREKSPYLNDFTGLGLVNFYTVPHHTNPPFTEAAQKIIDAFSSTLPLIPLSNSDAILITNDEVSIERS